MDFLELSRKRYSVRSYSDRPIEKDRLDKILEAGRNAPTALNMQPQKIYVIQSDEGREKVKKITHCHYHAPCYLLVCYNENESWFGPDNAFGAIDAAIVGTHMMLEATEQGLGTVWVAAFYQEMVKKVFDLSDNIIPVALIPIGYPSDRAKPSFRHDIRKDITETAEFI